MKSVLKALRFGRGYPLLIALAAMMDLRRTGAFALNRYLDTGQVLSIFEGVNYLLLAEWMFILAAVRKADWSNVEAGASERFIGLALALCALFGVAGAAHWPTMAVCFLIGARLIANPSLRWLSLCLIAVAGQNLFTRPEFDPVHGLFARVDAWAVHHFLTAAGYANTLRDTVLQLNDSSFAIEILPACATSSIIPAVLTSFLVFSLGRRTSADSLARGACVAVAACFVLNILRLSLMAQSPSEAHYWHEGEGVSILSVAICAIGYLTAVAAARRNVLPSDAEPIDLPASQHG